MSVKINSWLRPYCDRCKYIELVVNKTDPGEMFNIGASTEVEISCAHLDKCRRVESEMLEVMKRTEERRKIWGEDNASGLV